MSVRFECDSITGVIKQDFGSLWNCKQRGNSLEIITPFSTSTQKFVSVFITKREGGLFVSDGGWVSSEFDLYGFDGVDSESEDSLIEHYGQKFRVESCEGADKRRIFFKKSTSERFLSNAVYDLASFVCCVVNGLSVPRKTEKLHKQRFSTQANTFLGGKFLNFKPRYALDDYKTAVFSAAITHNSQISLVAYVTGTRPDYFINDFKEAIFNFEAACRSKLKPMIKARIALINNEAQGYSPQTAAELVPFLKSHDAQPVVWTEKESLAEIL